MKRKINCLIICFLLLAIFLISSKPVLATVLDKKVLNGVVFIYWEGIVERYDNEGYSYADYAGNSGSGFFVGNEGDDSKYIITNYHVIEDFVNVDSVIKRYADVFQDYLNTYKNAKQNFPLYICYGDNDAEEAYVVDYDKEKDLAILKINAPTNKRLPLKLKQSSENLVGDTVWAIGYPGVADLLADSVTSYGISDATVTVGSVNRIITQKGTGTKLYQTDAKIRAGNSGGPLVDNNRCVLGINTSGAIDELDPNLNYAISIDELLPLLTKNNVPFSLYQDSVFNSCWLFIIIGAIVLFTVLIFIIFFIKSKSKTKALSREVVVPASDGTVKNVAQSNTNKLKPIVHSLTSQHGGMTVSLSRQPVFLGRDVSSCQIIFREGTPGVSSKHCSITYNEAENIFILIDLSSTYGTYLANGQRLMPNIPYPLKQRDSFYLGEKENSFYVDLG